MDEGIDLVSSNGKNELILNSDFGHNCKYVDQNEFKSMVSNKTERFSMLCLNLRDKFGYSYSVFTRESYVAGNFRVPLYWNLYLDEIKLDNWGCGFSDGASLYDAWKDARSLYDEYGN